MMRWIRHSALALALVLGATPGCGRVLEGAITAAPALLPVSTEQEIAVGRQAAQEVLQETPALDNAAIQAYVQSLGEAVAAKSGRTDIAYHFTVIESTEPNAFALPGGYIFGTTALLKLVQNEAQLAGVLGHEVAHVAQRHAVSMIREQAIAQGVEVAAVGTEGGVTATIANVVAALVNRGYGRAKELEADEFGTEYLAHAGYAPSALSNFLVLLDKATGGTPAWLYPLATHPPVEQRVQAVQRVIAEQNLSGGELNAQRFEQVVGQQL